MQLDTIVCADALDFVRSLPDESVHCAIASPPYFNLRDYGVEGQMGLDTSPQEYIDHMVTLFREVKRVLRKDGTCWINIGDSYWNSTFIRNSSAETFQNKGDEGYDEFYAKNGGGVSGKKRRTTVGLPQKSLTLIPFRLAIALQEDEWIIRSDIIWSKPASMPESVTDRPSKSHEYIFLLSKSRHYYYDQDSIREPVQSSSAEREKYGWNGKSIIDQDGKERRAQPDPVKQMGDRWAPLLGRNKRSVWTVPTESNSFAHFATFPQALIEPMILAGVPSSVCAQCGAPWTRITETQSISRDELPKNDPNYRPKRYDSGKAGDSGNPSAGQRFHSTRMLGSQPTCICDADTDAGIVLDPFMGSGTVALVARRLERHWIGCDLNAEYVSLANERLSQSDPYQDREVGNGTKQLSMFSQRDE